MKEKIGSHGKMYEYKGKLYTLRDLCNVYGVGYGAVAYRRKKLGMSLYDALTKSPENYTPKKTLAKCPPDCRWGEWHCHEVICMYMDLNPKHERRPCKPGKDCTVYESGKRKNVVRFKGA